MYTNAAIKVDEEYDILLPTFFNDLERDGNQECRIEAYLCKGEQVSNLKNNFCDLIDGDKDKWIMASPGLIKIGDDYYVSYMVKDATHAEGLKKGSISRYKIAKMIVK